MRRSIPSILLILLSPAAGRAEVDFNRDVRPILSDRCFRCHGPDTKNQRSDLRLDSFANATRAHDGFAGVVPGQPEKSEIMVRVEHADPDERMPPPKSKLPPLTRGEREILREWIADGAEYDRHWSFVPVRKPPLPDVSEASRAWVRNGIDHFVAARLEVEGLQPSPPAQPDILRRRTALALTGLLPDAGLDGDLAAQVEHHLASMHYAERMALEWLDAARYADTDGYQNDAGRSNWPWRDWVIKATHDNMPFDRFTIEQIAGDMLPGATMQQRLASAFNRNHRQNSEGGALAPEFFVENVIDRVETTSTVFLGLTMGCARCHDHKFDPLSQREFFQMFAYFNNIGEKGTGKGISANPILKTGSPLAAVSPELTAAVEAARTDLKAAEAGLPKRVRTWAEAQRAGITEPADWVPVESAEATTSQGAFERQADGSFLFTGKGGHPAYTFRFAADDRAVTALRLDLLPNDRFGKPRRLAPSVNGNFVVTDLRVHLHRDGEPAEELPLRQVRATFEQPNYGAGGLQDGNKQSGWAIMDPRRTGSESLLLVLAEPVQAPGTEIAITLRHDSKFVGHHPGQVRVQTSTAATPSLDAPTGPPPAVTRTLRLEPGKWNAKQRQAITAYVRSLDGPITAARTRLERAEQRVAGSRSGQVPVMIMQEAGSVRPAYLLNRGQYDDPDKSEALPRAVPASLLPPGADMPENRLELARWLVSPENPLTARVIVNRAWQQHFGVGLVKTVEDFGLQGDQPSHPGLLDWLAATFMESGWDVKALHRLIVTSATWRQSSRVPAGLMERDPDNRLLARGPRFRLDGFAIRDIALQASGLLSPQVGGPPVRPYQPAGLWNAVAGGSSIRYKPDGGDKLYRRSLYTYWKRAVNPPRQILFDAAGRETCNVRKRVTNTPLQALVLMNDPTFVEAARQLAQLAMQSGDPDADDAARIQFMAGRVLARELEPPDLAIAADNLNHFRRRYREGADDANTLLAIGASPRDKTLPAAEHAAFTLVAHLLLNLDEAITLQ